jgi:pyruvate kinase
MYSTDELFNHAVECSMTTGMLHDGDITVMTAGVPLGISGTTNLMKVHVIGDILATGQGFGKDPVQAHVRVCLTEDEVHSRLKDGEILVVHATTDSMVPYIRKASALIVESTESFAHARTLALALDIPLLANCENATHLLKTGVLVTLNPKQGTVQYTSN